MRGTTQTCQFWPGLRSGWSQKFPATLGSRVSRPERTSSRLRYRLRQSLGCGLRNTESDGLSLATRGDELNKVQHGAVQKIQPVRFAPASLNSRASCVQRADAPRRPRVPKAIRHATSLTAGAQPAPQAPKRGRRQVASSAEKSSAVSWKSLLRADQRRCHTQT